MYRQNALRPTPPDPYGPNSPTVRRLRNQFTVWLLLLPLLVLGVVIRCWDTIEALIRLVHHDY